MKKVDEYYIIVLKHWHDSMNYREHTLYKLYYDVIVEHKYMYYELFSPFFPVLIRLQQLHVCTIFYVTVYRARMCTCLRTPPKLAV